MEEEKYLDSDLDPGPYPNHAKTNQLFGLISQKVISLLHFWGNPAQMS